ncbi:mannose-6-phosphate isomerase, class I [Paraflavisolibacter sp. H34]|uniref:mannose-6-phosphate isomerase, class I n=1 Tax=Huijunlia imazamoxiresistens TaxID=3127457 RepID=UPI0030184421
MAILQHLYPLQGKVQHYSWGGYNYLAHLLRQENPERKPWAEYWLGAHPNFPGFIPVGGSEVALNQFIKQYPEEVLGEPVYRQFGALPFLLKVLDIRQMLSIQVHPGKAEAEEGFAKENKAGIPENAPHRNYKDDNHKPELMVALGDFWLLHGFKPAGPLRETLETIPEFSFLLEEFDRGGYKALYETALQLDQQRVNEILDPIASRIVPLYRNGELLQTQEDFWAARAVETFCRPGHYDRGIFSIYFFNLLHLKKGEAIYQPAQMPHAYLEGQNVEIMANSDNVLRAGLTDKHIDVSELLQHVRFAETVPQILGGAEGVAKETVFTTPAAEFELLQYRLSGESLPLKAQSAEVILVLNGSAELQAHTELLQLAEGQAAFIVAGTSYTLRVDNAAEVFRATVPAGKAG